MIVLLFLTAYFDNGAGFEDLEIYRPLSARSVVLSPRGHLYVAPHRAETIQHFDAEGNRLANIGRKGKGPGEFQMLTQIFFFKERLYALDRQFGNSRIHVFDADGQFQESLKAPSLMRGLVKTFGGWAYIDASDIRHREPQKKQDKFKLVITDETFENIKEVYAWEEPTMKMRMPSKNNVFVHQYNPAPDYSKLLVSKDGHKLFFYKPGKFEVHVVDVGKGKIAHTIEQDMPRTPFNKSWGEEKLEGLKKAIEERPNRGFEVKYQADFPDYFPAIGFMSMDVDGRLWITPGSSLVDKDLEPLILDHEGNPATSRFSKLSQGALIGVYDNWAYLTTFDHENEEASIQRMPISEVNSFLQERKASMQKE